MSWRLTSVQPVGHTRRQLTFTDENGEHRVLFIDAAYFTDENVERIRASLDRNELWTPGKAKS